MVGHSELAVAAQNTSLVRNRIGRVVEVRVRNLSTVADVQAIDRQVATALRCAGPGAIICADHRFVSPLSGRVADAWAQGMRAANKHIARSALLIEPLNTTFNLQADRIVRCAGSPTRRLVTGLEEMRAWLGGSLSNAEWRGIETFFAGNE